MTIPIVKAPPEEVMKIAREREKIAREIHRHPLYEFLRFQCRDILGMLQDGRISCAKAAEAIVERELGREPLLPPEHIRKER